MGNALKVVVRSDARSRDRRALAENTRPSVPDLTCTEQWPTPAESRHSQFDQEQKTTRASSSYRARPLQDPLVPLPSCSWPSTRPASKPQAGTCRHRRRHPRATILSHREQLWRVGEDRCLSARIPVWSRVDAPNVALVLFKLPARFASMKGRVSDHVVRYTPKSGRKCIDSMVVPYSAVLLLRFLLKIRSVRILDTIVCSGTFLWLFSLT